MRNIGVRAEHMSSTFSVYQKVRIHMSILSGMWESIASTSLLKRFSNRPVGVLSKKVCGARRTPWSMLPCMNLAARSILWARHSRQLTNNSAPAGREEVQLWWHNNHLRYIDKEPVLALFCYNDTIKIKIWAFVFFFFLTISK